MPVIYEAYWNQSSVSFFKLPEHFRVVLIDLSKAVRAEMDSPIYEGTEKMSNFASAVIQTPEVNQKRI